MMMRYVQTESWYQGEGGRLTVEKVTEWLEKIRGLGRRLCLHSRSGCCIFINTCITLYQMGPDYCAVGNYYIDAIERSGEPGSQQTLQRRFIEI